MNEEDFRKWIEGFHLVFQVFEGRHDAYSVCRKWVDEWHDHEQFNVSHGDRQTLLAMTERFDHDAHGIPEGPVKDAIDHAFDYLIHEALQVGTHTCAGTAVSPYLFTWNIQRFSAYFQRNKDFDVSAYFEQLGAFLASRRDDVQFFQNKKLYLEDIHQPATRALVARVSQELKRIGIHQNEPVGTAKLLHMFAPSYFPLIDNPIAEKLGLKVRGQTLTPDQYLEWMSSLRSWLSNYEGLDEIETDLGSSILKLLDEGLYVMCSMDLSSRIDQLGIETYL